MIPPILNVFDPIAAFVVTPRTDMIHIRYQFRDRNDQETFSLSQTLTVERELPVQIKALRALADELEEYYNRFTEAKDHAKTQEPSAA